MPVRILFFATYADLLGRGEAELSFPAPTTVAGLLDRMRQELPGADRLPARPMVAVNQRHAGMETPVADADEVAFLPPLAGG
ncbi:MAG: MoaD/ThiS family protein [Candidatus Aminicenantes bacterium]|jgi:molybdopterin converting factor subunit 1|nr:MAG: MoaD/ThiS family protein [Candidatus Aminicenantes bacterium]